MKRVIPEFVIACLIAVIGFSGASPSLARVPESKSEITLSFAPLVKSAAPAVVNVYTRRAIRARRVSPLFNDPFFRRFFGDIAPDPGARRRTQNALGSGVIVRANGVIVTNNHVIEGADEIVVALADRREFEARVLLADERTDLAILKIEAGAEALPALELRDSDELEVGDLVLAIGNPFGVGQTVTSGIVSALARTQVGAADYKFFIQTDAAINPGNSGGALVSMDGRLVGVNTAIYSRSGGSIGIGFAVPSNMVRTVVAAAIDGRRDVVRAWLGVSGQAVTSDIAASLSLPRPAGVLLNRVDDRGPMARAGLVVGDVVTAVDGRQVDDPQSLRFRIGEKPVGGVAVVTYLRAGREASAEVALEPAPEVPARDLTTLRGRHPLEGATVANLSPALVEETGFPGQADGVVVLDVGRTAARLGFRPFDLVRGLNGVRVGSVDALEAALRKSGDRWRIEIERGGRTLNLALGR